MFKKGNDFDSYGEKQQQNFAQPFIGEHQNVNTKMLPFNQDMV